MNEEIQDQESQELRINHYLERILGVEGKSAGLIVEHVRYPLELKSENWQETADQWRISIKGESFDYYTGVGWRQDNYLRKPKLIDIFYSLTMDSIDVVGMSFVEWCSAIGFNADSIKDRVCYGQCKSNAKALQRIGFDLDTLQELYEDY